MAQHHKLRVSVLLMATAFSSMSYAAGYAIIEQSVTGLGRAFAGSAAVAEDASTIFFNPAGLTYLEHSEMDVALNFIAPQSDFNDDGSTIAGVIPLSGGDGGDAGKNAFVPNFYYSHKFSDRTVAGIGVNAPFGLVTEYDDTWKGRYHAVKSDLKTVNINPTIAFKPTEKLSLGFGLNLQYIDLELTQMADFGAALFGIGGAQTADGKVKLTADDWSWGYNLGLIYQATQATRLGLSYRSKISHHLKGDGKFSNVPAPLTGVFFNGDIDGKVTLPESASFAVHHELNDQWAVSADATWTRWNRFQELVINSDDSPRLNSSKDEKWDNTMRYGLGLTYLHNDKWTFRGGIAYDETPISDEYRTARIPGEDRKWVAIGATYKYSDTITIDAGYTHIFLSDPDINETLDPPLSQNLVGEYDASVDILGVQMRWLFL